MLKVRKCDVVDTTTHDPLQMHDDTTYTDVHLYACNNSEMDFMKFGMQLTTLEANPKS